MLRHTETLRTLASILLLTFPVTAPAAVIFNNFEGLTASGYAEETRDPSFTFGTVVDSLRTTRINQIGVRWRPNNDMNVKFNIWESELSGTFGDLTYIGTGDNTLLFSQTKYFRGDPGGAVDFIFSDPLDFTFEVDKRYDIGIIFDVGSATGSWDARNGCDAVNTSGNAFDSINANATIVDFAAPRSDAGYGCVDPHIQLIAHSAAEPSIAALVAIGLTAIGLRRRSSKVGARALPTL